MRINEREDIIAAVSDTAIQGHAYEYNGGTASSNSLHAYCLGRMFDFLSRGNTKSFRLHLFSPSL